MESTIPKHGEERNRHHWQQRQEETFTVAGTGEKVSLPVVGHSGTRSERYCAHCQAWQPVGAGLKHGLIGFIICPGCNTPW